MPSTFRWEEKPDVPTDLPTSTEYQSCAICDGEPVWLHPLRRSAASYRAWDKGHSLPNFWFLCQACEDLYDVGADDDLAARMLSAGNATNLYEDAQKPIAVFRRADLGARRVTDHHST